MTPQALVVGAWMACGACNCVMVGALIFAFPGDGEMLGTLRDLAERHGVWPFAMVAVVLMALGPVGLFYELSRIGPGLAKLGVIKVKEALALRMLARAQKRRQKSALERAKEVLEQSRLGKCPCCSRLVVLDETWSLPSFPAHPDLTLTKDCPGSGMNHTGPCYRGSDFARQLGGYP
jgi:hypothetical protein